MARRFAEGLGMPAPVLSAVETLARFGVGTRSAPNPATAWGATRSAGKGRKREREGGRGWRPRRRDDQEEEEEGGKSDGGGGGSVGDAGSAFSEGGGDDDGKRLKRSSVVSRSQSRRGAGDAGDGGSSGEVDADASRGRGSGGGGKGDSPYLLSSSSVSASASCKDDRGNGGGAESHGGSNRYSVKKMLRKFLADASPLHAMALVVVAARACPGWESWCYVRPALLPPPPLNTAAGGEGESTSWDGGGGGSDGGRSVSLERRTNASAGFASSRHRARSTVEGQQVGGKAQSAVGLGSAEAGALAKEREGGGGEGGFAGCPNFAPTHEGELGLLLRGRLPEYLRFVERWSGGVEGGGNWVKNGDTLSPVFEDFAKEVNF